MAFITKCAPITKIEAENAFKKFNYEALGTDEFNKVRITGKPLFSETRTFIQGTIFVRRRYMDYDYDSENFDLRLREKPIFLKDDIGFILFPEINIISFDSKEKAKLFGTEILSKILYSAGDKIRPINFNPQTVREAKKKGIFDNIWFNGVREEGNISYTGQYGEDIDEDNKFIDVASRREGIGVEITSKIGKRFKVAAFKSGSLVKHITLKNSDEDILLLKEIISIFLPFSNYESRIMVQTEIIEDYQD